MAAAPVMVVGGVGGVGGVGPSPLWRARRGWNGAGRVCPAATTKRCVSCIGNRRTGCGPLGGGGRLGPSRPSRALASVEASPLRLGSVDLPCAPGDVPCAPGAGYT